MHRESKEEAARRAKSCKELAALGELLCSHARGDTYTTRYFSEALGMSVVDTRVLLYWAVDNKWLTRLSLNIYVRN